MWVRRYAALIALPAASMSSWPGSRGKKCPAPDMETMARKFAYLRPHRRIVMAHPCAGHPGEQKESECDAVPLRSFRVIE